MATLSVVFAKCQKCFPYYSSGAITRAMEDLKISARLTEEGFLLQSEGGYQETRTLHSPGLWPLGV